MLSQVNCVIIDVIQVVAAESVDRIMTVDIGDCGRVLMVFCECIFNYY